MNKRADWLEAVRAGGVQWMDVLPDPVELSKQLPGILIPLDYGGIAWINGRQHLTILRKELQPEFTSRQHAVSEYLGTTAAWTPGGQARQLLKDIADKVHCSKTAKVERRWNYSSCKPCQIERAYMHDMTACYWRMLASAPSPRPVMRPDGKVVWMQRDTECERLQALTKWVRTDKRLRNSLIGAMVGSSQKRTAVSKGEFIQWQPSLGPWPELGLLIARSAFELTMMEVQRTGSVYSNVDCVISTDSKATVWEDHGMSYTTLEGDAEVQCPGGYRVGHKTTKYYKDNGRFRLAHNPGVVDLPVRFSRWLLS